MNFCTIIKVKSLPLSLKGQYWLLTPFWSPPWIKLPLCIIISSSITKCKFLSFIYQIFQNCWGNRRIFSCNFQSFIKTNTSLLLVHDECTPSNILWQFLNPLQCFYLLLSNTQELTLDLGIFSCYPSYFTLVK